MASPSNPSNAQVAAKLKQMLKTCDLDTATQRELQEQLSTHFGVDMAPFSDLITGEIEQFIQASVAVPADAPKRARDDDGQDAGPAAKAAKASSSSGDCNFSLGGRGTARAYVKEYNGKKYVDLRMFYEKGDEMLPTKKGIMLSAADWSLLSGSLNATLAALEEADVSFEVQLSGTRRVTISDFKKGAPSADIREWYESNGELKPGNKGLSLDKSMLQELIDCAAALTEGVGSGSAPSAAAAAGTSKADTGAAEGAGARVEAAGGAVGIVSGTGDTVFELGGAKFASASQFKGNWMIGLREYYQKDGNWMPGKKGISLAMPQFEKLQSHAEDITRAIASKDESLSVEITDKRKVSVSQFKGSYFVNIREYYTKNGDLLPSTKGIALKQEQWGALCSLWDVLRSLTT